MTDDRQSGDKNKDVIYIDVDEDITGIIAKIRGSSKRIIALVLPKRFATMQSIVNMKLLKRAGEREKKSLVLITSESSLLPLAAAAGVHVAKTLQSKPEIPEGPLATAEPTDDIDEVTDTEEPVDKSKTIGELHGDDEDDESPIELNNETPAEESTGAKKPKTKSKKDKKLKIPNFNKFRLWLILGGLGVVLIVFGLIWALVYAPKASILVNTDSTAVTSSGEITLDTAEGATLDVEEAVLPAQVAQANKTLTAEVEATGQKNNGQKASGTVTMTAQNCSTTSTPPSVTAGSGVTTNGKTYLTQTAASFTFEEFNDGCLIFKSNSVKIIAQNGGADHNAGASSDFTVAGRLDVTATGSAQGGTDDIIKIVTQADIDKAKEQIQQQDDQQMASELSKQLESQSQFALTETLSNETGEASSSVQANEKADKVKVTQVITYKMLGVKREELEKVIAETVADKIDTSRQTILDYGLSEATFTLQNQTGGKALVGLRSVVTAGPDLNVDDLKTKIAGLKSSEAKAIIEENPGVVGVEVTYGPFWVRSIPKNTSKITITIQEPEVVENNNEDNDAAEQ